jgi:paraquat-inducible protein A
MACPQCDLLHRAAAPARGVTVSCRRCGAALRRGGHDSRDAALALYLTALILFILANAFPLLEMKLRGQVKVATLPGCASILAELGWPWLSGILLTTAILAPFAHLLGMAWVLFRIRAGRQTRATARMFRLVEQFQTWGMAEVFVLGILVSYVKLAAMATLVPGPGLYALGAFVLVAAAALSAVDPEAVWHDLGDMPLPPDIPAQAATAKQAGLVSCLACRALVPWRRHRRCPRCNATLRTRKPESRQRTWALLATALVLYLPANLLPVMKVVSLGKTQADTIMGGVIHFAGTDEWLLAGIIFLASVLVPALKISILAFLLLAEQRGMAWKPVQRARLYRLTELVGRWSMVDIFAVSLMVAMVSLGNVATIEPAPGSVAFALLVVVTMLAALTFDPRLVWDNLEGAPPLPAGASGLRSQPGLR